MSYKVIKAATLEQNISFHRPDHHRHPPVTLGNPALEVMTDLKKTSAVTIHPGESMEAAKQKMIQRGVRMLLVTDYADGIIGVITANDIQGERPIQFVQKNGGSVKELKVQDVMTDQAGMDALNIKEVANARVGDIVETLRHHHRQHALVVDNQGARNEPTVRGIFSLTQIARQLGVAVQTYDVAENLAEIAHFMQKNHP
ncbi:MAG: CBS domain-containing protein [Leptospirales bacterium]|nr:CBS domain-containing protein [Leptospirales bacterium]